MKWTKFIHPLIKKLEQVADWSERHILFYILLFACTVFFIWFSFASDGSWGGADAIVHYRIARYSWIYPHLFLDLWGKPVFTILSSPLAQLGFNEMKLFNVLAAILTTVLSYRILQHFDVNAKVLIIPFLLFAPMYFILVPTTLTEPLFGLFLIAGAFFFLKKKHYLSAILIALLPFIRNEGFVVFPYFIIALYISGKYKAIPLLFSGYIVFGIIGALVSGDPAWLITHTPYFTSNRAFTYASGSFFHYINNLHEIWGPLLLYFSLTGLAILLIRLLWKRPSREISILILIVLPALTYLAAHSFVFWKGIGGAAGLFRIMTPIIPSAAIVSVYGISEIVKQKRIPMKAFLPLIILILSFKLFSVPFSKYPIPFPLGLKEEVISQATGWAEEKSLVNSRIYYYHPYVVHALSIDPFDERYAWERVPLNENLGEIMPEGSLIFWDSHFGPNEGQMPLKNLMLDSNLVFLRNFPEDTASGDFHVYLFRR